MSLGDESLGEKSARGWTNAVRPEDCVQFGAATLGLASLVFSTGAAAQQAADPAPLPPLEVTAKKGAKKKAAKAPRKAAPAKSAPAPSPEPAAPAPVEAAAPSDGPSDPAAGTTEGFTPGSGNTLESGTGIGRLPGTVQDTPQVVNVVPQQQLQQQNTTTVEQALRNVPGVTVAIGEGGGGFNGDQFRVRGFEAKGDLYIDGLRDVGVYVRDSFAIEEVQVIKGPSSETFGHGTTGGVINLRQKTAHLGDSYSFDVSVGTDSLFRAVADANKQINSTTAVRAVGMYHTQDQPDRDHVESERWGFLGSLAFGLSTDTTWVVNYLHQSGERTPDYGVPVASRNPVIKRSGQPVTELGADRSNFYGRVSDHDDTTADMVTSRFKKELNENVTFYNDTRYAYYTRDFATTVPNCTGIVAGTCAIDFLAGLNPNVGFGGGATPDIPAIPGTAGGPTYVQDAWSFQNVSSMVAKFHTGFLRHELVAGIDVFYQEDERDGIRQRKLANTPVRTPNIRYNDRADFVRFPADDRFGRGNDLGLFVSDRLWLTKELSLLGGVRWDKFESRFTQPRALDATGLARLPIERETDIETWSPKASVIWEPTPQQTYYASWATSSTPVGLFVTNALNPIAADAQENLVEENESYEIGAKYSLFGNKLGLTGALFQIDKNGASQADPATGFTVFTGESQRVRGFEVGLTGSLTSAWIVNAGYTYLDAEITYSPGTRDALGVFTTPINFNKGNAIGGVPEHAFSVWSTYNLSESLIPGPGKWTIGGGVLYQDEMFTANNSANINFIPDTVIFDAMLSYELDGWRFAVNGYNLTDELNYDASFNNRAIPSAGTSAVFTIGKKF